MNETMAILPLPRTPERIYLELRSAEDHLTAIRNVAAEFYNLDHRPIVIYPDGRVERIGAFELPSEVSHALLEASLRVGMLRFELATAPQPALQ